jgi:DNA invertase Pin-like site-specific DNA recombinase
MVPSVVGLKGTMSEAELHVLRARLQGGILAKARRGELPMKLPVGLVYGPDGAVGLDPDRQVQAALRALFALFRRTGSARAAVRSFRQQALLFPYRVRSGPRKDELAWSELGHTRALAVLHNPRYAGAFAYGRTRARKTVAGRTAVVELPRAEWTAFIPDAHPGYIGLAEYEENLRRLRANAHAQTGDRRRSPPREGPALLQGLVVCGRCGQRMTVGYRSRGGRVVPYYACQQDGIARATAICQRFPGWSLDEAIGALLVEAVTPLALEVALAVQDELAARAEEADRLRRHQVERARTAAEQAQRRFMRVDPDHRLVADSLEADWNQKLRDLAAAQETYERQRQADGLVLDGPQRAEILALATDFPRLWRDPATGHRDRKRMLRLIVDDVTLTKAEQITAEIRFRGGATRTITVPVPARIWMLRQTPTAVVEQVDRLLDHHTDGEIAALLNAAGARPGVARAFTRAIVADIRRRYGLRDRFTRLRARGLLTQEEIAAVLGVHPTTVQAWQQAGRLASHVYNDKHGRLYEPPAQPLPAKFAWQRTRPRPTPTRCSNEERDAV